MREDGKLDYLELPAADLPATKEFYNQAFGWTFVDYGPTYAAFDQGLDGGFDADQADQTKTPLPILYAHDLEAMLAKVEAAGGRIVKPIYSFPGNVDTVQGAEIDVATGWVQRTTSADTTSISVDIEGVAYAGDKEDGLLSATVVIEVQ